MTTYFTAEYTCAVCGHRHQYTVVGSTSIFGSPDLDLRPAPMRRDTIHTWVQTCPDCGYTAGKIDKETSVDEKWLSREAYKTCEGIAFGSQLAAEFYRSYMVHLYDDDIERAAYNLLYCAWACDDARDIENAVKVRAKAADLFAEVSKTNDSDDLKLLRMDLLRRSGQFDRLLNEYHTVIFSDDLYKRIASFQMKRAIVHDTGCHSVEEVVMLPK